MPRTDDQPPVLRSATDADIDAYRDYLLRNREATAFMEPVRADPWYERAAVARRLLPAEGDRRHVWIAVTPVGEVVGESSIGNIVRGSFQNGYLGVSVDTGHTGHGLATTLVEHALRQSFEQLGLHRVDAGHLVEHVAIARIAEHVGMRPIGISPLHVHVNGAWRDHVLIAITVEHWRSRHG